MPNKANSAYSTTAFDAATDAERVFTFGDSDLGSLVMCRPHRSVLPGVDIAETVVPGRAGAIFERMQLQPTDIEVEVWLRNRDRENAERIRHKLAAMLFCETPQKLVLPDDPKRYSHAVVSGTTDLGLIADKPNGTTITFHCSDPLAYGEDVAVSISGTKSITPDCGWIVYPVITVPFSSGLSVRNATAGKTVQLSSSVTSGSTAIFDMAHNKVTVDGDIAPVTLASDFWGLYPGVANTVTVSSGTASIEYTEAYL